MEAASIPVATTQPFADSVANRIAIGIAAGLLVLLVHGEAARLANEELTWRALFGS